MLKLLPIFESSNTFSGSTLHSLWKADAPKTIPLSYCRLDWNDGRKKLEKHLKEAGFSKKDFILYDYKNQYFYLIVLDPIANNLLKLCVEDSTRIVSINDF